MGHIYKVLQLFKKVYCLYIIKVKTRGIQGS
jgi:hypothetical protein